MPLFIGNVFSTHDLRPADAADPTFAFTKYEKCKTSITNLPIRIEHEASLTVGRVLESWDEPNGCKWILGSIDDGDIIGKYASLTVKGTADELDTKKPLQLYGGLSLGHESTIYQRTDGTVGCIKEPKEISICTKPRRSGCSVLYVCRDEYKCGGEQECIDIIDQNNNFINIVRQQASLKNMSSESTETSNTTNTTNTTSTTNNNPAQTTDTSTTQNDSTTDTTPIVNFPKVEEMASTMFKLEGERDAAREQNKVLAKQMADLRSIVEEEQQKRLHHTTTKAEALLEAVRQQYAEATNGQFGESEERILQSLLKDNPEDAHSLLTVMQTAHSQKNTTIQQLQKQLNDQNTSHQNTLKQQELSHLSTEVHRMMGSNSNRAVTETRQTKRPRENVTETQSTLTHEASSQKQQKTSPLSHDATMQQVRQIMRRGSTAVMGHVASLSKQS